VTPRAATSGLLGFRAAAQAASSFKDLTFEDAGWLIDQLQTHLGVKPPPSPQSPRRDQARRAGLDGRKDGQEFASAPQMASAADLATIEDYYSRLGWAAQSMRGCARRARRSSIRPRRPSPRSPMQTASAGHSKGCFNTR